MEVPFRRYNENVIRIWSRVLLSGSVVHSWSSIVEGLWKVRLIVQGVFPLIGMHIMIYPCRGGVHERAGRWLQTQPDFEGVTRKLSAFFQHWVEAPAVGVFVVDFPDSFSWRFHGGGHLGGSEQVCLIHAGHLTSNEWWSTWRLHETQMLMVWRHRPFSKHAGAEHRWSAWKCFSLQKPHRVALVWFIHTLVGWPYLRHLRQRVFLLFVCIS